MSGTHIIKAETIELLADNPIIGTTPTRTIPSVSSAQKVPATTFFTMSPPVSYSVATTVVQDIILTTISSTPLNSATQLPSNAVALTGLSSTTGKAFRVFPTTTNGWFGFVFHGELGLMIATDDTTTAAALANYNQPLIDMQAILYVDVGAGPVAKGNWGKLMPITRFVAGGASVNTDSFPIDFVVQAQTGLTEVYITLTATNLSTKTAILFPKLTFVISPN